MGALVFNIVLYGVLLGTWFRSGRSNSVLILVPIVLFVSSIFNLLQFNTEPKEWKLTYGGFLYLFVAFNLFIYPLWKQKTSMEFRVTAPNTGILNCIAIFYIVMAVLDLTFLLPKTISAFQMADWLKLRQDLYWGDYEAYDSIWERVIMNSVSFLRQFSVLYFFFLMTNSKQYNRVYIILLGLCSFLPSFASAVFQAARGTMIYIILEYFIAYMIFSDFLSVKVKRVFKFFSLIAGLVLFTIIISITLARFDSDAMSSVYFYIGHSMMSFNYGVIDTLRDTADGKWMFGNYYSMFTGDSSEFDTNEYGCHCGTSFITAIGCLVIDYGIYIAPVALLIIAYTFTRLLTPTKLMILKKEYSFSKCYLMFFYINFLISGILVYPLGYFFKIFCAIVVYLIIDKVKMFEYHKVDVVKRECW